MGGWMSLLPLLLSAGKQQPAGLQSPQLGGSTSVPPIQSPKGGGFMNMLGQGAQACMGMNPPAFCKMMTPGPAGAPTPEPGV